MRMKFWSSRAIRLAGIQTLGWCAYAVIPVLFPPEAFSSEPILDGAVVFALGLFMALRINRAYERWWEARTLWGALVNASRNLAVKVRTFVRLPVDDSIYVGQLISGFAFGLRDHLRGRAVLADLEGFGSDDGDPRHVPGFIAVRLYGRIRDWERNERITGDEMRTLDIEARVLLEVAGACERIRNTPLPHALTWATRLALAGFLLAMPWLAREELGWLVVPLVGVGAFFILLSETIAGALEHPFGTELNQLDLTAICVEIEESTRELLEAPA